MGWGNRFAPSFNADYVVLERLPRSFPRRSISLGSTLRSRRSAIDEIKRFVRTASAPDTEIARPACPSDLQIGRDRCQRADRQEFGCNQCGRAERQREEGAPCP